VTVYKRLCGGNEIFLKLAERRVACTDISATGEME